MSSIDTAVSKLYETFSSYPLTAPMVGCPCCVSEEMKAGLHRRPLRELTWADLQSYSAKAVTTFGTVEDLKHFFPRILELIARSPGDAPFPLVMILGKFVYARWREWPEAEVVAVEGYIDAARARLTQVGDLDWDDWDRQEMEEGLEMLRRGAD